MSLLPNNLNANQIAHFIFEGKFRFRLLEEAYLLSQFLAETCPNPTLVAVSISELLVNAIEHGNLGITSEEKTKLQQQNHWLEEIERRLKLPEHLHQYVEVEFTRTNTEICIKITDQGKGFNWQKYESKNPLSTHGRGLLLAKELAFKSLKYSGKGNEVTCVIALK